MKSKFNKNTAVAVVFLLFVFAVFGGTCHKAYKEKDRYISAYSDCLGERTSTLAKTKALVLTGYNALLNADDRIFAKNGFINVYGLSQRMVGNRYIVEQDGLVNEVVLLDNGSITFVIDEQKDLAKKAEHTQSFNKQLQGLGIDLLYVQYPFKINKFDKGLPAGVEDYSNENADRILDELNGRGVVTFDLREEISKELQDYASLFFKTDHHWKPETGLWAAKKISEKLNDSYGFQIDTQLLEKECFTVKTYQNQFLGSMGKRVGRCYAGTDDFSLLLPSYHTQMSNVITQSGGGKVLTKQGSFEQTFIFGENISKVDYFKLNAYIAYSGGDYPLCVCKNSLVAGKKIVVLRDSYSCVVTPFLSLAVCKELHIIDPRLYKDSITGYIVDIEPDVVLMLYNPGALQDDCFFEF